VTIAEMIGETPEMMRACGMVLAAEWELARWEEAHEGVKYQGFFRDGIEDARNNLEDARYDVWAIDIRRKLSSL
jgi:hypothetical protein